MRGGRTLLLSAVASGGAAWLIWRLWAPLGLPPTGASGDAPFPGLWRWHFAIWLPALFPAFTTVHWLLDRWGRTAELSPDVANAACRWDRRSYALLPLFLLLMLAWSSLGNWRILFATFFVALLFAKVTLVVVTLYRGYFLVARADDGGEDPHPLGPHLFIAALLLYAFLTPYTITAVSTAGDEHTYLLKTHSLYSDGDLDVQNNAQQRDWATFYWGRPGLWAAPAGGFPVFLLPGYALGRALLPHYALAGRLGATLTIGVFAALLGLHVYRLCRETGASRPAAFWAWAVVALGTPVLVASGHVYAEIPAAFALVLAVRAVLRLPERAVSGMLTVLGTTGFVVLLKERYGVIAGGLCLWAFARLAARWRRLVAVMLAGLLGAGAYLVLANPFPMIFVNLMEVEVAPLTWNWYMPQTVLGLLADQEFGLLYYAPHWTLVFVGIPLLWRRRQDVALGLLGMMMFYLVILAKYGWRQWDAGWTPPPRFLLAAAPLLAPFLAAAFEQGRGKVLAAVNTLWIVWNAGLALALSVVPFWRYNNLDGRSTLLQLAGERLGLDLARFLPSLRAPTAWTWIVLVLAGLLVASASGLAARSRVAPANGWGVGAVLLRPVPAGTLVAIGTGLWLGAAAVVPTWSVEAEAMRHSTGIQFGSYSDQDILWVMKQPGELAERIVTSPGLTEITVVAGGYTTTGIMPRMTLLLDDRAVHAWPLRAGSAEWVRGEYVAWVGTKFAHHTLRLQFFDLLDERAANRLQHAYVDRIRLRRINSAPDAGSRQPPG